MTTAATIQLGLAPEYDRDPTRKVKPRRSRTIERREDLDFWPTPDWLARAMLRTCRWNLGGLRILDAGAGLGIIGAEAEKLAAERGCCPPRITALELHPERAAKLRKLHPSWEVVEEEFFAWGEAQLPEIDKQGHRVPGRSWDLVPTNPPQKNGARHVWVEWVTLAFALAKPDGGQVQALGHDLLLTTPERAEWWKKNKPVWWRPSPRRPSFSGDGGTDGRVWGWWQWNRGPMPVEVTRMELLEVEWP